MESTSYNGISEEYKNSHDLQYRHVLEEYTVAALCGPVRNQSVLDLACGAGYYTRIFKAQGADVVTGVDLSPKMIAMASAEEENNPLGITYLAKDVSDLETIGVFDIVTGVYLLNYARSANELLSFFRAALRNLKPGGRFIGLVDNPWFPLNHPYENYRKYGMTKECPPDIKDGEHHKISFYNADGSTFDLQIPYLSPITYQQVIEDAGFSSFKWFPPMLDPKVKENDKEQFWSDLVNKPASMAFVGERGYP